MYLQQDLDRVADGLVVIDNEDRGGGGDGRARTVFLLGVSINE
jgi:hypothetical protein